MKNKSAMISNGQLSKIYVLVKEIGLNNDILHDLVKAMFNKTSLKKLSFIEAGRLIERLGGKNSQENYIRNLEKQIGWAENPERLKGFIKGMFKKDSLNKLNKTEKSKLIEALKNMKGRKQDV